MECCVGLSCHASLIWPVAEVQAVATSTIEMVAALRLCAGPTLSPMPTLSCRNHPAFITTALHCRPAPVRTIIPTLHAQHHRESVSAVVQELLLHAHRMHTAVGNTQHPAQPTTAPAHGQLPVLCHAPVQSQAAVALQLAFPTNCRVRCAQCSNAKPPHQLCSSVCMLAGRHLHARSSVWLYPLHETATSLVSTQCGMQVVEL
jgi:hypothetical protein